VDARWAPGHFWKKDEGERRNSGFLPCPFSFIPFLAGGRGFAVRREDMKKLLLATRGKVFTLKTMDRLVEFTRLKEFRTIGNSQ